MGHKQLILELPDNNFVSIDEGLYDLINKMNRSGIKTTQCCQGMIKPHLIYIFGMGCLAQKMKIKRLEKLVKQ